MWTIFFILAIVGIIVLLVYLLLELNELEKKISDLVKEIKNHYEKD